jgi:hypothetical protein
MAEVKLMPLGVVQVGRTQAAPAAGGWLANGHQPRPSARERLGYAQALDGPPYDASNSGGPGHYSFYTRWRNLMPIQCWDLYRQTPDVRACVDSIVRRVATWDWYVKPTTDPRNADEYHRMMQHAKAVRDWMAVPSRNGETWQEVMTRVVTDLLVYDAGVMELNEQGGKLLELVPWLGSSWFPVTDAKGVLLRYEQESETGVPTGQPDIVVQMPPERLCYLSLFRNNRSNLGVSLLDTLVNECVTVLLSAEHTMLAMDADEIPPGLLVLAGVAGAAAERARADLQVMRGKDHKLRVLTSPQPGGIDAKWVEMRRPLKDVQLLEVVGELRRTIWRVFGVQPVELGESDGINRATAQVQMDVASSHLIGPILELVQARINAQVLPRLLPPEARGKVLFGFDRAQPLTPKQRLEQAQANDLLVKRGILTPNEVRAQMGLLPVAGGDVPMVDTNMGPLPLDQIVSGLAPANSYAADTGNETAAPGDADDISPLRKAVGDTDPTNFPTAGENEAVSLRNSEWELFDLRYAEQLRTDYPSIWRKGGNVRGNSQYDKLAPIVRRGGRMAPRNDTEEGAIRLREAWVARHREDFRLAGVVAQVKWLAVGDRGERYMKELLDAEKAKVDEGRVAARAALAELPEGVQDTLRGKARDHNAEVDNDPDRSTTAEALAQVWKRGVGAYNTNPESVRPTVSSPEQWAFARVESFLFLLRTGEPRGKAPHDTDLLPEGHPYSTAGDDERSALVARGLCAHGACGHEHHAQHRDAPSMAATGEWLPSDWQPAGRFAGMRTINLRKLAEVVAEYQLAATELYDRASVVVQASVAAAYGRDGVLDLAEAGRAQRVVEAELDKLGTEWAARSEQFYLRAARLGHEGAERMAMSNVDARWQANGRAYWQEAMGWLMQPSGLVGGLQQRVRETLNRATTVQRSRITDVDPTDTTEDVVGVVRATFAAQAARIDNWTGLLVGLSNRELTDALDRTVTTVNGQPVDWMVEWVNAGGRTCPTCAQEGGQGFRRLGDLARRPGEGTLCVGHCRCVLVFWTRAEVDGGQAIALSALAPEAAG